MSATVSGGPADEAALYPGDLVTDINGAPITSFAQLCQVLASASGALTVRGVFLSSDEGHDVFDTWRTELVVP